MGWKRKNLNIIDAIQFFSGENSSEERNYNECADFLIKHCGEENQGNHFNLRGHISVPGIDGTMFVEDGDFIVLSDAGCIHVCDRKNFRFLYEWKSF